jgi:mannose-6-phosphate isomerase
LHARSERWLVESALPLWASAGFDAGRAMFQERLDFDRAPIASAPRRLMVQARQISVYAAASLSGRFPGGADLALRGARTMIATFLEKDGEPGWAFSVDRDGRLIDRKRDLYAHAFVLFALAWVSRLENSGSFAVAIDKTLAFVDRAFADPVNGGCWDCLPRSDALRRQNPHMHLFEAYVVLYETTGRADVLRRCRALRDLALARFYDPATGVLREIFDNDWKVHPAPGQGSVEPGHLFEWAWLLRQYERVSGHKQDEAVSALISMARRCGLSAADGRIINEIDEIGVVRDSASRCWPHTEALKALAEEALRGDPTCLSDMGRIAGRLLDRYCPDRLAGGWIDFLDEQDRPASQSMPASSFYHIYFGLDALAKVAIPG